MIFHTLSKTQRGLSLLEILITLVLGVFIASAVMQVYMSNKGTSKFQGEVARIQDNGRFAIDLIARDLRNTDYFGCLGDKSRVVNHIKNKGVFDTSETIRGVDGLNGSPDTIQLIGSTQINEKNLKISSTFNQDEDIPITTADFNPSSLIGKPLVVANCQQAEIFIPSSINGNTISRSVNDNEELVPCDIGKHCFLNDFTDRMFLYQLFSVSYFLRDNILIRMHNGAEMNVAENVTDFQIHYGIDLDDDGVANRYVNINDVTDLITIVSVKVHLLIESDDNIAQKEQSTKFNWVEEMQLQKIQNTENELLYKKFGDKRLRYPFSVTIALRNRLI